MAKRILIQVTQSNRATIAHVQLLETSVVHPVGSVIATATGEALRHPEDKNDPEVGENLAVGRALTSLGKKLTKKGNGLVRMHEHNDGKSRRAKALRQRTGGHDTDDRVLTASVAEVSTGGRIGWPSLQRKR